MDYRMKQALEVLRAGGYFRQQLERAWHYREQFKTRLRNKDGQVVAGIGEMTRQAMEDAGMLRRRECVVSSVWPTEWELRPEYMQEEKQSLDEVEAEIRGVLAGMGKEQLLDEFLAEVARLEREQYEKLA